MIDLEQLQILAQQVDNMEILTNKLEKTYNEKDGEDFNKYKREILEIQKKISEIVR